MGISGKLRENNFDSLEVGLFLADVVAVNPSIEEFKEILGRELDADSKAADYLGDSKEGNMTARIDFWLKDKREKFKKVSFFLENKLKTNKDNTKNQYINTVGSCSWASDESLLPDWFKKREYRQAYVGEEDLYRFMSTWLGKLDFKDADTTLSLDFKKLIKGNVKEIKEQIGSELSSPVVALATVKTVEKEDGDKSYQSVYNRGFLPEYSLKQFRLVDYTNDEVIENLKRKDPKKLMTHERFVLQVTNSEHGVKESYILKDIKEYNPSDFLVGTDKVISDDDPGY